MFGIIKKILITLLTSIVSASYNAKCVSLKVVSGTFLLFCFVCLKESARETRINVFLFHLESSFCS